MTARGRFPGGTSRFAVTIARDRAIIAEAQRLRYRVFGEELGARLASRDRGLDKDEYDRHCDHLVVRDMHLARLSAPTEFFPRKPHARSAATTRSASSISAGSARCAAAWRKWDAPASILPIAPAW